MMRRDLCDPASRVFKPVRPSAERAAVPSGSMRLSSASQLAMLRVPFSLCRMPSATAALRWKVQPKTSSLAVGQKRVTVQIPSYGAAACQDAAQPAHPNPKHGGMAQALAASRHDLLEAVSVAEP